MAEAVNVPEPPQISPYLQIVMTDNGPVMNSNIKDGHQLVTLLEQAKFFVMAQLYPPPKAPLIQKVNGAVNRLFKP